MLPSDGMPKGRISIRRTPILASVDLALVATTAPTLTTLRVTVTVAVFPERVVKTTGPEPTGSRGSEWKLTP